MTKPTTVVALLAAVAATSGCSTISHAVGASKVSPDEFRVVTQAPLTLPPDYSLRPPRPGEPRPDEMQPDAEAHAALFGTDVGQGASVGEQALVAEAGGTAIDPNVREQVDFDGQNIVHRPTSFADRILGFHGSHAPEETAPLDPTAEQARLAEQESIRRATGGGQVIIERNARRGFKLPGDVIRVIRVAAHSVAALFSFIAMASAAYAETRDLPRPDTFTLSNGLQVVVITDRRAPVVTHMVWYRVGAADESAGHSGIAHFLEHLMFKGTHDIAPGQFSPTIARNGGDDNAFTSWDYTAYYERIARDRLELVMRMEADRMRNLNLTPNVIDSERDVIVEERRQRTDNVPSAVLGERMSAMLHPNHPYGRPIIGWLHEMQGLTRQDAIDWYQNFYAPNNAILVVAGDVSAAELRPLAERYYGRLRPSNHLPPRTWPHDPPPTGPMRVSHRDEKVRQPSLSRIYPAISYSTAHGREAAALDVAMEILGGSETSRLYRALVEDQHIAVGVSADADTDGIGGGSASLDASPAEGVSLETLEAAMDQVVQQFLHDGPTDEELARAKSRMEAAAIYARDGQESLAYIYGSSLAEGQTIDQIVTWPHLVESVTKDDVVAIVRQTLDKDASVTGYLLPPSGSTTATGVAPPEAAPAGPVR